MVRSGAQLAVIGADGVAAAVPVLRPLALSAGTRRADQGPGRAAEAGARSRHHGDRQPGDTGARQVQRVRPRTLLTIAAVAGAFYYLLPQIADVGSSWHALPQRALGLAAGDHLLSAPSYGLASALTLIGGVPGRVPFGPTV